MDKPKFLYHGSRYKLDIIKPHQAYGSPDEKGNEYGIYAYEKYEMVIPFSLTITPFENGRLNIYFSDETSDVTIYEGIWDETAIGYIYKLPSDTFEKLDDLQWLSTKAVVPIECTIYKGIDYKDRITFVGKAKEYRECKK